MIYQLVHHNNSDFTFVSESQDLQTEQEKTDWYNRAIYDAELPAGRQWGLIDNSHAWFTKTQSLAAIKHDTAKTVVADTVDSDNVKPLSMEEVNAKTRDLEMERRRRRFELREKLDEHMAEFEGQLV